MIPKNRLIISNKREINTLSFKILEKIVDFLVDSFKISK